MALVRVVSHKLSWACLANRSAHTRMRYVLAFSFIEKPRLSSWLFFAYCLVFCIGLCIRLCLGLLPNELLAF